MESADKYLNYLDDYIAALELWRRSMLLGIETFDDIAHQMGSYEQEPDAGLIRDDSQ